MVTVFVRLVTERTICFSLLRSIIHFEFEILRRHKRTIDSHRKGKSNLQFKPIAAENTAEDIVDGSGNENATTTSTMTNATENETKETTAEPVEGVTVKSTRRSETTPHTTIDADFDDNSNETRDYDPLPCPFFTCDNGRCIQNLWQCDLMDDCGDMSDEQHCEERTCEGDEYRCPSGKCIPFNWYCDQVKDCPNGEDEDECD